ncbi:hypothetical protein I4U23_005576 [Adineta vaga]|nr:hypothetical protein I4U23_005576 [Adineta vaga]
MFYFRTIMNCRNILISIVLLNLIFCVNFSDGGLLGLAAAALGGYGLCQTACNAAWVSCYASVGLVAGASTGGAALPLAAIGCNSLQGVCMASCAVSFLAA